MLVQKASFFISHCDEMGSVNLVAMRLMVRDAWGSVF